MTTVGFIGLGNMGRPMASNLVRKGFSLVVYDVLTPPVDAVAGLGARGAKGVPEVAQSSDVVITMLPDSAVVEEVITGANGVLAHARAGSVIMDMSTIDPLVTDRLATAAKRKGMAFVDAPVGRLASHAERGESLFMVGADEATFAQVKPLLEAMGTTIHHCGAVGTGMRTKLVNNYLAIISCQLNAEALALSQRFGLSLRKTLECHSWHDRDERTARDRVAGEGVEGRHGARFYHRLGSQGPHSDRASRQRSQGPDACGGCRA